jgi:hypothetical protein
VKNNGARISLPVHWLAIALLTLSIAGCHGTQTSSAIPRPTANWDAVTRLFDATPIGVNDPCFAPVAVELKKWFGVWPTEVLSRPMSFEARSTRGYIIAVYSDISTIAPCRHLAAVTVVPLARPGALALEIPAFSVRRIVVSPFAGGATILAVDKFGRRYQRQLVSRPFAFVINYSGDDVELYAPGPSQYSNRISTDSGSRINYVLDMRHGFRLYGPEYYF